MSIRTLGQLTAADLGTSGYVREAPPSKYAMSGLTYLHRLLVIRHRMNNVRALTYLTDGHGVEMHASSDALWEIEKKDAS